MIFRFFLIVSLIALNPIFSQREHVDGIIAWVETNPILKSEVLQAVQMLRHATIILSLLMMMAAVFIHKAQ